MFQILKTDGKARNGILTTPHGKITTPIFMPVGTVGSVKSLVPRDLEEIQAQIILGNTYHLFLRPGLDIIRQFGGLHQFIGWDKPILSDSGGYQIFSLGSKNKITEQGASFQSHIDGRKFTLTPELAVEIQETLNSDIHMVLDECTSHPATHSQAKNSMERSMRWAKRCREHKKKSELLQFGIVQGSMYPDLRKQSSDKLQEIDFEGYSIGGLSVGEEKHHMRDMTELCCDLLPKEKPRYLMGVGTPLDLIESVAMGVDMFDCVMPTRNGRNGCLFTSQGLVHIKNAQHKTSEEPLDADCSCYTCKNFSRAYLRHLFVAKELTALRLFSLHNLTFYLNFMATIRQNIQDGTFATLLHQQRQIWKV